MGRPGPEESLPKGWYEQICLYADVADRKYAVAVASESSKVVVYLALGMTAASALSSPVALWPSLGILAWSAVAWLAMSWRERTAAASTAFDQVNIAFGEKGVIVLGGLKLKWSELPAVEQVNFGDQLGLPRICLEAAFPKLKLEQRGEWLKFYLLPTASLDGRLETNAQRRALKTDEKGTFVRIRLGEHSRAELQQLELLLRARAEMLLASDKCA